MQSSEIRNKFLNFFKEKNHQIVPPHSLIPDEQDDSVLFTSAGMQQFKSCFLGQECPYQSRVATTQECFRTSDIEEVGDEGHLTLFEMLGNFSFGDYFKKEAIGFAIEFLEYLGLDKDRLRITYFKGEEDIPKDQEAYKICRQHGFSDSQIEGLGRRDNFWGPTGVSGPCGPTVEIHYDRTQEECPQCKEEGVNCSCGRFVEIWNIVFNQYYQDKDGNLSSLDQVGIDTGLGLERLAMVLQDVPTIFETDLLKPLITRVEEEADQSYEENSEPFRIIADHLRGITFLVAAGVRPDKEGRGYILRRLIRYLQKELNKLSLSDFSYQDVVDLIVNKLGEVYPGLEEARSKVVSIIKKEEKRIKKTTQRGLKELKKVSSKTISGEEAFELYSTYGLSPDKIKEKGYNFKQEAFEKAREEHKKISRQGAEKKFGGHGLKEGEKADFKTTALHTATHLLQAALRSVLGDEVRQKGSHINQERLRFDFSFPRGLKEEEISAVEKWINNKINQDLEIKKDEMSLEEARQKGFLTVPGADYPDIVTVYYIKNKAGQIVSKEVCAGPHVERTGLLGEFKIIKEKSSSRGVRRIKAILQ